MGEMDAAHHAAKQGTPGAGEGSGAAIAVRPLALGFRIIAVAVIAVGIVRIAGLATPTPSWRAFLFYTVMSNLLCLVWMFVLSVVTIRDLRRLGPVGLSTPSARFGGAVMLAITTTLLIYLLVLVPSSFTQDSGYVPFSLTDNLVHIITPCLIIIDWALFSPKGVFRWTEPLLWLLMPAAYLVFALIAGGLGLEFAPGMRYPYPFLNVAEIGAGGVAAWVGVLALGLLAVGYAYVMLDRMLAWFGSRRMV